jgi:polyisoprenoid-binding protein YceI
MKTAINFFALFLLVGFFTACSNAPEGQSVEAEDAVETTQGDATAVTDGNAFMVNTDASKINWTATKVGGGHNGTIAIESGKLMTSNGNLVAGQFNLDMKSIVVMDLQGEKKQDLEGHLNSGDFFESDKFPEGSFTITSVQEADGQNADITHNITGNLTLKGQTKSVTIPANVVITDNIVSAVTPPFNINRTEWGINYGSGVIGTAADKIIHDEIGLVINLQAMPAK